MKRGALLLTLVVAAFAAACSNGGGNTVLPPPPPNGFSNASLKGQYAFIMTGQAGDTFPIGRIGTFVADGNGNIQGGTELVDTFSNNFQQLAFSANTTYSVSSDGRGAINLLNSSGQSAFSITFTSPTAGFISETDGQNTTSGTFELQDLSSFSATAVTGPFVFDTSGQDSNGAPDSVVGQIQLNSGVVQGGVYDENDAAVASGPTVISNGSFSVSDLTNGLGTLTFNNNNFQYAVVIVNSKKFHLIEIPPNGTSVPSRIGTATAQTAPPATTADFSNGFAITSAGVGTTSPDFKVGRFTADGKGNLSSIALDEKLVGASITQVPNGTISAATYAIDPNFPNSGRGTATFTDSHTGTYQFIFYMASGTQGVIQDVSKGIIGDGTIFAQTGAPFSNGSVAGDYAFNWSGTDQSNVTFPAAEEDFVGHVTVSSAASANVTGAMDFSNFNSNQGAFHDSALNGTLTINGDGTTSSGSRSTFKVTAAGTNGGPSTTFTFSLYPVNATTMFVVSQDTDHSTGGIFTRQVTPP
ncbi:MAG TPA: hypothetical protein VKP58_12720 [Candidatus Acidoferrum sp.]|nr:hypothetical protein [Candidatus Acidoferrum sp.]